ncbi:MAG: glycosyltransferase family 2 protein [Devosia sp.]|nr:glycosyltransferase family 2 protein [Devosia sp.]
MILAVVVPSFKVRNHILAVVTDALQFVDRVYVVDDCCPERSGQLVEESFSDPRVTVLRHAENQGVGGAVVTGYRQAMADGCDIVIKMDGDGQMEAAQIPALIRPIVDGTADYAKGNRFFAIDYLRGMPTIRLLGNSTLSFVNKLASGYWNVMDPTNGFTAIHTEALRWLPLERLARRYFFESDMLFRLATIRAVVRDVPIPARYGDEVSSLRVGRVLLDFPLRYAAVFVKRFVYCYILRDLNVGTIESFAGMALLLFGLIFGAANWAKALATGMLTPSGTVMLASIAVILGVQFLLAAVSFDVNNVPDEPLHRRISSS